MDHYTPERLILQAHRERIRTAERRALLVPTAPRRAPVRWWMAGRLRSLADRLDPRPAAAHLRLVD